MLCIKEVPLHLSKGAKKKFFKPYIPWFPGLPQQDLLLLPPVFSSRLCPLFLPWTHHSLSGPLSAGCLIITDSCPAALRNARRES